MEPDTLLKVVDAIGHHLVKADEYPHASAQDTEAQSRCEQTISASAAIMMANAA